MQCSTAFARRLMYTSLAAIKQQPSVLGSSTPLCHVTKSRGQAKEERRGDETRRGEASAKRGSGASRGRGKRQRRGDWRAVEACRGIASASCLCRGRRRGLQQHRNALLRKQVGLPRSAIGWRPLRPSPTLALQTGAGWAWDDPCCGYPALAALPHGLCQRLYKTVAVHVAKRQRQ